MGSGAVKSSWGPIKQRLTASQLASKHVTESEMDVSVHHTGDVLRRVIITLRGSLAAVPSLKNSKIPRTNFTNPAVMGKIKAMDQLFLSSGEKNLSFGAERVHVLIRLASQGHTDRFNAMETIADWLEPKTKKVGKRERGWGIGLINDDSQVLGFPYRAQDGLDSSEADDETRIWVTNWKFVELAACNFVAVARI